MESLPLPQIDQDLCTGCRRCVEVCPPQALAQIAGKAMLFYPERCTYCTVCQEICPEGAIDLPFLIVFGKKDSDKQQIPQNCLDD